MKSILLIREGFSHMENTSGFDLLCESLSKTFIDTRSIYVNYSSLHLGLHRSRFQRIISRFVRKPTRKIRTGWPSPFISPLHAEISEMVVQTVSPASSNIILLTYGENQYSSQFVSASTDLRRRIVLVLHQPPSWHRLHWLDTSVFNGLGAIACMSQELAQYVSTVTATPTFNIHHGVDVDFFQPSIKAVSDKSKRLLFVGQWLRDFETLEKAFTIIHEKLPGILLDCVIPFNRRSSLSLTRLARFPNVHWHAKISSNDLRMLYRRATLLFLPLVDATANNAIVEALACGLPVISSGVGGISEYIDTAFGELCAPGDANAHAEAALRWLGDGERRERAAYAAREFAEKALCWRNIATELLGNLDALEL